MPIIQHLWNQLIMKVTRKRRTQVIDLPYDVKVNILIKLPADLLYQCAQLSIPLKNLISRESFIDSHLQNNSSSSSSWQSVQSYQKNHMDPLHKRKLRVDFIDNSSGKKFKKYYEVHFDREEEDRSYSCFSVLTSCNGLLFYVNEWSGIVLNPITGQYLIVKKAAKDDQIHAFFFHPRTRDYRMIGSHYAVGGGFQFMIYSVTKKSWRLLQNISPNRPRFYYYPEAPVIMNGVVHWIASPTLDGTELISFNIDGEEWGKITTPHGVHQKLLKLQQIQGLLCLCNFKTVNPDVIDIWVLENYYDVEKVWIKRYVINLKDARPHLLLPLLVPSHVQIVKIEKDQLWFRWGRTCLAHHLQLNTWTTVAEVEDSGIYPHINSLVSL